MRHWNRLPQQPNLHISSPTLIVINILTIIISNIKHSLIMTTFHIQEFYVGLNGKCVEVVKLLQSDEKAEDGIVLGLDGPELPVRCDIFPHIGIVQLSKTLPQIF